MRKHCAIGGRCRGHRGHIVLLFGFHLRSDGEDGAFVRDKTLLYEPDCFRMLDPVQEELNGMRI